MTIDQRASATGLMVAPEDASLAAETAMQQIADMILRQCSTEEILLALCAQASSAPGGGECAFLLTNGSGWKRIAPAGLSPASREALDGIDPEALSSALLAWETGAGRQDFAFGNAWARHLYSGVGELLGIIVFPGQAAAAHPLHAARVESACRLAVLAIEQNNLIHELTFRANHDALTGLTNRTSYERQLRGALRSGSGMVALLYLGLDRFRLVNDVLGQRVGNQLLVEAARRFQSCAAPGAVLARTGGDEFALLLRDLGDREQAAFAARDLLDSLREPFRVEGHEVFLSAGIGLACSGPDSTPESLQHEAFIALYQAKRAGRGRVMPFEPSMAHTPPERLEMEKRLRFALQRREFVLHYQPQLSLTDRRLVGVEALLRWRPDGLGLISPACFIPILEDTGLIIDVGAWVLGEACRQAASWTERAGFPLRVAVNISALQIAEESFPARVKGALDESGISPSSLELELTESVFVGDFANASRMLHELGATGATLALDDFGAGQSSLAYLNQLPFDRLKVDQSFIRPIPDGGPCPPLVDSIVNLARSLGMATVAEGIETAHQADVLGQVHCDEGQGFYFARPMPPAEFEQNWLTPVR
jgi:diguanylate cyclase (GGDEF)-like protein